MNKEEQREADIDSIAEVIYTAIHGNDAWEEVKYQASMNEPFGRIVVRDTRLQAEHVLASHWLSKKITDAEYDARQDGRDQADLEHQYEQNLEM